MKKFSYLPRVAIVFGFLLLAIAFSYATPLRASAARPSTQQILQQLGGTKCPGAPDFTCVAITVPLDHFNQSDSRTIQVTFAVRPASGQRKGMFVTATGGPGTSGVQLADPYIVYFHKELFQDFDLVFFDQRGVGLSGGLTCPNAAASYYAKQLRADSPALEQKMRDASNQFASECDSETGHSYLLPYLGTNQAVEDLEAFRQVMQDDKFWLYGESYATQYSQTYAQAHPDRLAGMVLDGTVDLTYDGVGYFQLATQSFNRTLLQSLAVCSQDPRCAADFGKKPQRAYDQLAARLTAKQQTISFPLGNAPNQNRKYNVGSLEYTGISQMFGQSGRMLYVRALAAYARDGDLIPLARLWYSDLVVNESNFKPILDPSWSDAEYYNVECQDYGYYQGSNDSRATQYIAAAKPVELSGLRLSSLIWGDFPCVYWRASSQDPTRPPYGTAPGIPTLVLNALSDPITPIESARAVYSHLDDGYLITQRGGPHVLFGRGVACIDNIVTNFLVEDKVPAQRETECKGAVMDKYVPLAPADAHSFASPLHAAQSAETEINHLPEFWNWDYVTDTSTACGKTGTVRFFPHGDKTAFTLNQCSFSKGFVMTGSASYDSAQDYFRLDAAVSGYQSCYFTYTRTKTRTHIDGTCAGTSANADGRVAGFPARTSAPNIRDAVTSQLLWK